MYNRNLSLSNKHSFFLFGARGTGKSTLLKQLFNENNSLYIDLLNYELESELSKNPMMLEHILKKQAENIKWVIIDEVQKVPKILDTVHRLIEQKKYLFALTGSSARKLKRGGANLLAGRAFTKNLFPLTHLELESDFDLLKILSYGSLPYVFALDEADKKEYLKTYVQTYLKEEIQVEQLVRKIDPFKSFLDVAAQCSGELINYSNIARDINSDASSVISYFEILEDTLMGFNLQPYHTSIRKRQRKNPKFYLFDIGVKRALEKKLNIEVNPKTYEYGKLFEHFIVNEIYRLNEYFNMDYSLYYLRTKDDVEVDLILERTSETKILIEIKSTDKVMEKDVSSLSKIGKEFKNAKMYCLSLDNTPKIIEAVTCVYWKDGLKEIFKI